MSSIDEFFDEKELKNYESMFESVIQDLWNDCTLAKDLPEGFSRLQKCLEYNLPYHNKYRGFLVPCIYKAVTKSEMSESQYQLAQKVGWAVQIHTALVCLIDDMHDDTEIRFRKPSWWSLNKKSLICMNDTFLVEHAVFRLLEKYLNGDPLLFAKISSCLNNVMYQFILGTSFELELLKKVEEFTMEGYLGYQKCICGEAFFSAFLEIPLWLAKNQDDDLVKELRDICNDIGYIFTLRDDLLDSFGDKKEYGGTDDNDIKRGKINWLILTAKELSSKAQWEKLKNNFGKDNMESVEVVKTIYEELGVPKLCRKQIMEHQAVLTAKLQRIQERWDNIAKPLLVMAISYTNLDE